MQQGNYSSAGGGGADQEGKILIRFLTLALA